MTHEVHEVSGILAVVDRKSRIEPNRVGIHAQQPRTDGVEGAGPRDRGAPAAGAFAQGRGDDAVNPPLHLARRAAREGQEQDAAGVGTVDHEMGHPVGERVGLTRTRPSYDEEWARNVGYRARHAVLDSAALLRIEAVEIACD